MSVSSRAVVLLGLALGLVAPAHAADVSAEYARQVDTAQMRVAQVEATLVEMESSLRRMEQLQQSMASQPSAADGAASSDAVRALRGDIEVLQFELRTLKESVEALALDTDTRLLWQEQRTAALERALGLPTPPMPVPGAPLGPDAAPHTTNGTPVAAGQTPGEPATVEGLMELAVEHMTEDRPAAARAVLERLIAEYPDDIVVPEAVYRIAETWFNQERWLTAVTEFQKVVDRYPRHELASWAMLRQGEAFDRRGARGDAVLFWEGVVSRYPGTPAAEEAADLLE